MNFNKFLPNGFVESIAIERISEIKDLEKPTFSIVFQPYSLYKGTNIRFCIFWEIGNKIAQSDTILCYRSEWIENDKIETRKGFFEVKLKNDYFSIHMPLELKKIDIKLIPYLDTSNFEIDGNWIVYNQCIGEKANYSGSLDTIYLYPFYKSKENEKTAIPINQLVNVKFSRAACYYTKINLKEVIKFLEISQSSFKLDSISNILDIKINEINYYNTNWSLYLESDKYKGWVRKNLDFDNLGLCRALYFR
jgi:hypothetical protein